MVATRHPEGLAPKTKPASEAEAGAGERPIAVVFAVDEIPYVAAMADAFALPPAVRRSPVYFYPSALQDRVELPSDRICTDEETKVGHAFLSRLAADLGSRAWKRDVFPPAHTRAWHDVPVDVLAKAFEACGFDVARGPEVRELASLDADPAVVPRRPEFPAFVFLVAEMPLAQSLADAVALPSEVRRCTFLMCPTAAYERVEFPADSAFTDEQVRLGTAFMERFVETIARRFQRTGVYTPYHVRGWRDAPVDDVCAALGAVGVRVVRAPELTAEIGHDLTLADFAFQSEPIPGAGDVVAAAARQLLAAAGLPDHFVPWLEAACYGEPITEPEVRVGLRIGSIRKKSESRSWTVIQLSTATFGARTGALLAWSADLDPELYRRSSGPNKLSVNDNRGGPNVIDLVLLDKDATARLRALATGGKVRPTNASAEAPLSHDEDVSAIAITPDGAHLASVGNDGRLRIWDARTDASTASVVVGKRYPNAVAVSPDGGTVATGPLRPGLFAIPSGKRLRQLAGHPNGDVKDLRFSPSGALLATASARVMHEGGADHSVALWNAHTGKPICRWALPVEYRELRVAFSPDEARLFVFGLAPWGTLEGGSLWAFDVATRVPAPVLECQPDGARSSSSRPALVATATEVVATDGADAWIFDAGTLNLERKLALVERDGPDGVGGSAPSPDGLRVALIVGPSHVYNAVLIVSLDGVAAPKRLTIPGGTVGWTSSARGCLAWSASGKTVAAAHGPRVFRWDLAGSAGSRR